VNRTIDGVNTGIETVKNVGAAVEGDFSGLKTQVGGALTNTVNGAVNSKLGSLGNVVNVNVAGSPGISVGGVDLTAGVKALGAKTQGETSPAIDAGPTVPPVATIFTSRRRTMTIRIMMAAKHCQSAKKP
jgi:hypothetical protein